MTTEEIKDLIASKIAGQGNQVDVGNGLTEILNELVDLAGQGGNIQVEVSFNAADSEFSVTEEQKGQLIELVKAGKGMDIVVHTNATPINEWYGKVVAMDIDRTGAQNSTLTVAQPNGTTTVKRGYISLGSIQF